MYQIGDTILYAQHGVCRISGIETLCFKETALLYYLLHPVYQEHYTIYVPVENEALTRRMRRILCAEEIYALIKSMPAAQAIWREDESERKELYQHILAKGDRRELICLIKALYNHANELAARGKKLHVADERFFKDAEKMLYEEFALVLDLNRDQVLPFILEQIELSEKRTRPDRPSSSPERRGEERSCIKTAAI